MATAIVKRLKNGAVHYAAAVNGAGVVQSWSESEAKAVPVTLQQASAMETHYRGRQNAGTLVFVAGGKEVGRIETPTEPPPSPGALAKLRTLLGLNDDVPLDRVAATAIEELEAFGVGGTAKEGPSKYVRTDADDEKDAALEEAESRMTKLQDRIVELTREVFDAKKAAQNGHESVSLVVDDDALDTLIAGNSVTGFDASVTITLTRPAPAETTPADTAE